MNQVTIWHVRTRKELSQIRRVLSDYSIVPKISTARTLVPRHAALLVPAVHARRAGDAIMHAFGRRSGKELE